MRSVRGLAEFPERMIEDKLISLLLSEPITEGFGNMPEMQTGFSLVSNKVASGAEIGRVSRLRRCLGYRGMPYLIQDWHQDI